MCEIDVCARDRADADDESHAEPERDAGDDGEARDLSGGQAGARIDPVADGAAGDERETEREGDGVARERAERRGAVGHVGWNWRNASAS